MRTIIIAALVMALNGCSNEVETPEPVPAPEPEHAVGWDIKSPEPEREGFCIEGQRYEPPPPPIERGYIIKVKTTPQGQFEVQYIGTGLFDITMYHVNTLGEIRATPEAMNKAGYEGWPLEVNFN